MTRKEEAYFETELADYIMGNDDTTDKEFFERIVCANNCIARCLSRFKDDYDEVNTDDEEEVTTAQPYYIASVSIKDTCVSLGCYSTKEKAKMKIVEYENALNPSITHDNWEELMHAYSHNETKISDYDILREYPDV